MNKNTEAFAYFITCRTYGTWLHGDQRFSTSRINNQFGKPFITPWQPLHDEMHSKLSEPIFILNSQQYRQTVLESLIDTCQYNHWKLYAAHVRENHVHIVLQADADKEKTMRKLKCYATKYLKKNHPALIDRMHFWSRHGSTINIWAPEKLFPVLYYVIKQQGTPVSLYFNPKYYDPQDEAIYEAYFA